MKRWIRALASLALLSLTILAQAQSPTTVLVVANQNNAQSQALARYYMQARSVPTQNLLLVSWNASDNADNCSLTEYTNLIASPVYAKIATLPRIDYIVLCRNLPVRVRDNNNSVDNMLAGNTTVKRFNPYNYCSGAFSAAQYGIRLVTRLDGWSWEDAAALVYRSITATSDAPIFLDMDTSKGMTGGYGMYNNLMQCASRSIASMGKSVGLESTTTFTAPTMPLGGYFSWGSNDKRFSAIAYNSLRFAPGAIAETLVSTSASNIRFAGGSQSQIAQLVHNGVTGIKGYVAEPLLNATANPGMLFACYLSGRNLAESFYCASSFIGWKDVVLGDPLCAPYRR